MGQVYKKTCSKLNQKNHFQPPYKFLISDLLANPLNKYLHNLYGLKKSCKPYKLYKKRFKIIYYIFLFHNYLPVLAEFLVKIVPKPPVDSTFKHYTGLKSRATNRLPRWSKFIKKTCSKLNQKKSFLATL